MATPPVMSDDDDDDDGNDARDFDVDGFDGFDGGVVVPVGALERLRAAHALQLLLR